MKAIGYTQILPAQDENCLVELELPQPAPGPRDLLVRVHAVSVNPVDTKQRKRKPASPEFPVVLGYDAAGTVEALGAQVKGFRVGDEVYYAGDITRPGTNSKYHCVDARIVALKPRTLDFTHAASLPLTSLTAYETIFEHFGLSVSKSQPGIFLLIGGAGGVGTMAIQMAKLAGLRVVTTASRTETETWVREFGADDVLDHRQPLKPQMEKRGITGADFIFNTANTVAYWDAMADIINPFGKICSIVETTEPVDLAKLMAKSVSFTWELMFTRSLFQTADMGKQGEILSQVASWIDEGRLKSPVAFTFEPITAGHLRQAHLLLESGKSHGKIVLAGW